MSHRQLILIVMLCLILLAGCESPFVPVPPATGTLQAPPVPKIIVAPVDQTACPEPTPSPPQPPSCPTCPDMLHAVTIYAMRESPEEAKAALRDYVITAEDFKQEHILIAGSPAGARINLLDETVLPVVAWGREVAKLTEAPLLTEQEGPINWRLYIRGNDSSPGITCAPDTGGLSWQELLAFVEPEAACPSATAYRQTSVVVCYMSPGTTTAQMAEDADRASVWIDAAVFDLKDDAFGLVRFGPIGPSSPAGPKPCSTVCNPIKCKKPVGCFLQRLCRRVCPN